MAGKFVVKKGTTGKFRFTLVSSNGQVVATSEAYNSKAACLNGVKSVRTLSGDAALEDQTTREWAAGADARKAASTAKAAAKRAAKKRAAAKATPARKAVKKAGG